MNWSKVFLTLSILFLLVACRTNEPIILNNEVELLPISVMGDLDYQSSSNRFVGTKSGENISEVYIYDLDKGTFTLVSDSESSTVNRHPKWNPMNEQLILFRSDGEFGKGFWIGTVDLTSSQKTAVAKGRSPEWLPDGESIAYVTDFYQISIHEIATGQEELLLSPELESGDKIIEIAISPNGQYIAFVVDQLKSHKQIFLADITETGMKNRYRLVTEGLFLDDLDWSANSDFLIIQKIEPKIPLNILAFNLEKSCLTDQLSISGVEILGYEFDWSDDNQSVFVEGNIGNRFGLLKISVNGDIITQWLNSGDCNPSDN